MYRICRLCLKATLSFVSLHATDEEGVPVSSLIKSLIPEVYQGLTQNPVVCTNCLESLQGANNFRMMCLRFEKLIGTYIRETQYKGNTLDLQKVVDYWLSNNGESSYNHRVISYWFGKDDLTEDKAPKAISRKQKYLQKCHKARKINPEVIDLCGLLESPETCEKDTENVTERNLINSQQCEPSPAPKNQSFQIRVKPVSTLQDISTVNYELSPQPNITDVQKTSSFSNQGILDFNNEERPLNQFSSEPDSVTPKVLNSRMFLKCKTPNLFPVIKNVLTQSVQDGKATSYTMLNDDSLLVEINDSNVNTNIDADGKGEELSNSNCDNIQDNEEIVIKEKTITDTFSKNNDTCDHEEIKNEPLFCYEETVTTSDSVSLDPTNSEITESVNETDFLNFLANEVKNNMGDDDQLDLPEYVNMERVNLKKLPNILKKYSRASAPNEKQKYQVRRNPVRKRRLLKIVPVEELEFGSNRLVPVTESQEDRRNVCVLQTSFTSDGDYVNDHDYLISPYTRHDILNGYGKRTYCYCALCNRSHLLPNHVDHMSQHKTVCPICGIDFCNVFILNLHVKCEHSTFCNECSRIIPYEKRHQHLRFHGFYTGLKTRSGNEFAQRQGKKRPRKQDFDMNLRKRMRWECNIPGCNSDLEDVNSIETANLDNNLVEDLPKRNICEEEEAVDSLDRQNSELNCVPKLQPPALSDNLCVNLKNKDIITESGETPNLSSSGPDQDPLVLLAVSKNPKRKLSRKALLRSHAKLKKNKVKDVGEVPIEDINLPSPTISPESCLVPPEHPEKDPLALPEKDQLLLSKRRENRGILRTYANFWQYKAKTSCNAPEYVNSEAAKINVTPSLVLDLPEQDPLAIQDEDLLALSVQSQNKSGLKKVVRSLKQYNSENDCNTPEHINNLEAEQDPDSRLVPVRKSKRKRKIKKFIDFNMSDIQKRADSSRNNRNLKLKGAVLGQRKRFKVPRVEPKSNKLKCTILKIIDYRPSET